MKKVISIILSLLISTIIASFSACADENNVSFTDEKSSESIVEETIIPTEATEENATEENATEENAPEVEVTYSGIDSCAGRRFFLVYEKRIRICLHRKER